MKLSALLGIVISVIYLSCNKPNDGVSTRLTLSALQGTWKIKSVRCYQNPNSMIAYPPDAYYKFNPDLSGFVYAGSITNQYYNFTYNLLSDDSTLVIQSLSSGGSSLDTSVITALTAAELVFHGINTYPHGLSPCFNGNGLDSLYK
jgi:hypothetical protein